MRKFNLGEFNSLFQPRVKSPPGPRFTCICKFMSTLGDLQALVLNKWKKRKKKMNESAIKRVLEVRKDKNYTQFFA